MEKVLGRYSSYAYAILRIVIGFLFLQHGTQKFFAWPPAAQAGGGGPLEGLPLIAAILEVVCGVLILVGFFTNVAAFIASGLMAVAYFMVHQPMGTLPISNRGELAVVYCFIFLYMAARGSGIWSVDSMARGSRTVSGK